LFTLSCITQQYNLYSKRSSYEKDKTFLWTRLIKTKDMQKDGGRDARETERHEDINRVYTVAGLLYRRVVVHQRDPSSNNIAIKKVHKLLTIRMMTPPPLDIIQRVIIYFLLSTNLLDNLIFIRRHASLAFNEDFDFQNYTFYPNKVILS